MKFKKDEYIKLDNGILLHVIYADEEKALCLYVSQNRHTGDYYYVGSSKIISNKNADYNCDGGYKRIAPVSVSKQTQLWKTRKLFLKYR